MHASERAGADGLPAGPVPLRRFLLRLAVLSSLLHDLHQCLVFITVSCILDCSRTFLNILVYSDSFRLSARQAPTVFMELHGTAAGVEEDGRRARELAAECGGGAVKWGGTPEERSALWSALSLSLSHSLSLSLSLSLPPSRAFYFARSLSRSLSEWIERSKYIYKET